MTGQQYNKVLELMEKDQKTQQVQDPELREFVAHVKKTLGYSSPAKIRIYDDHEISSEMKAMGSYFPDNQEIWILRGKRVRADWYRSLAHELVHHKQREDGTDLNGEDGSDCENEANSKAAVFLREWGREHPEIYQPA